ncbi:gluconate 2-dehydrogenase subunit 3 family protein [Sphingobacterium corticis]|uniref:Gluconate 2-dehydrogenase subunit 3 family protein n=1 Tax=Sphingobacterium corticis TaxID=1812823 RepID=A0ABW5NKC8_9SPHI
MNRREALQRVALLMGGAVIGGSLFLEGCTRKASKEVASLFEKESMDLLGDLAEAILPKTSTPGAKEAGVGSFIPVMIRDCYNDADQKAFMDGFGKVDDRANEKHGKKFQELSPEEQLTFVNEYDKEAKAYQKDKKDDDANHFFTMLKQLTLTGFFTSEVGMTQALNFVKIPGRYDGEFPYKKGDKAWAI